MKKLYYLIYFTLIPFFLLAQNVGIGTATPNLGKLQINEGGLVIKASENSSNANSGGHPNLGSITFYGHARGAGNSSARIRVGSTGWDDAGYIAFETIAGGSDATERMRISEEGYVGIGRVNPSSILDVFDGDSGENTAFGNNSKLRIESDSDCFIEFKTPNNSYAGIYFTDNTPLAAGLSYAHNNTNQTNTLGIGGWDAISFRVSSTGGVFSKTERMRIKGDGKITMGNGANSTHKLSLPINSNPAIGMVEAYDYTFYSDGRLKSQRQAIPYGLNEVLMLNPIKYFFHDVDTNSEYLLEITPEGKFDIGFIAQDLHKVLPELVSKPENESKSAWGISYAKLTVILTKAVQELHQKNMMLEERIQLLEQR